MYFLLDLQWSSWNGRWNFPFRVIIFQFRPGQHDDECNTAPSAKTNPILCFSGCGKKRITSRKFPGQNSKTQNTSTCAVGTSNHWVLCLLIYSTDLVISVFRKNHAFPHTHTNSDSKHISFNHGNFLGNSNNRTLNYKCWLFTPQLFMVCFVNLLTYKIKNKWTKQLNQAIKP